MKKSICLNPACSERDILHNDRGPRCWVCDQRAHRVLATPFRWPLSLALLLVSWLTLVGAVMIWL